MAIVSAVPYPPGLHFGDEPEPLAIESASQGLSIHASSDGPHPAEVRATGLAPGRATTLSCTPDGSSDGTVSPTGMELKGFPVQ
jgi:hypothetical protein